MLKLGDRANLPLEARLDLRVVRKVSVQGLDGHLPLCRAELLFSLVDSPHSPFAQ